MSLMEVRKSQESTEEKKQNKTFSSISLSSIKSELKKITWTDKDELKSYTKIVISATFLLGMGIYLADLLIQAFLYGLGSLVKMIVG